MKIIFVLIAMLVLCLGRAEAKEAFVNLADYVATAEAITICTVEKDNGDGTVTVAPGEVLKGTLGARVIVRGETGHCVIRGPVSRFMKPKHRYLVFLFKNHTVGRLGGILEIADNTLFINYIDGFTGTTSVPEKYRRTLPVAKATAQIKALLRPAS